MPQPRFDDHRWSLGEIAQIEVGEASVVVERELKPKWMGD